MRKARKRIRKWVKKLLFSFAKKHPVFRRYLRRVLDTRRKKRYASRQQGQTVNPKQIVFSSFSGRYYSDSPKALYEYMLQSPAFQDYTFIWAFRQPRNFLFLLDNPRTRIVKANTRSYEMELIRSKFWLMNYRVADHIYPTDDQVYVQLWHGTPLKRLGYDIEISDNAMNSKNEIRDKYRIDAEKFKYILAPSSFAAEKFASAWNLEQTGKTDRLLVDGYPRNDILVNCTADQLLEIRARLGLLECKKKIILYTPTWRDNQHTSGVGYTYQLSVDFDKLQKELGEAYIILFRAHYLVAHSFDFEKYQGFVYNVSDYSDINHLYLVSDLLITDYSSVFFDYAILQRPILYYMYDLEAYAGEIRGFYLELSELPGPIVRRETELIDAIHAVENHFSPDETYRRFNQKFNALDDGGAAQRVAQHTVLDENRKLAQPCSGKRE